MYPFDDQEREPKPFDFVPITPRVSWAEPPGHHVMVGYTKGGACPMRLEFEGITLQPLHVGSGAVVVANVQGGRKIVLRHTETRKRDRGGEARHAVIPGSSLRGAVRSVFEAFTNSCVCIAATTTRRTLRRGGACSDVSNLCPACSLFGARSYQGAGSYQGRIAFQDVVVPKDSTGAVGTPNLWQPARGNRIPKCYFSEDGELGRKFYFHRRPTQGKVLREVVGRQTRFRVQADIMPGTVNEAGAVICAMGCHPGYSFPIKLGAAKPAGFGSVRFALAKVTLFDARRDGQLAGRLGKQGRELEGEELRSWVNAAIASALEGKRIGEAMIDAGRLKKLAEIYSERGLSQSAPSGVY